MLGTLTPGADMQQFQRGFTLIELLIVVGLIGVIAAMAGPSLYDYMLKQRLRGIHAQLITDLQFARSEAVSRGNLVGVRVQAGSGMSCYIINTRTSLLAPACDCTAAEGARCSDATQTTEIRTVQVPASLSVEVGVPASQPISSITFDPRNGALKLAPSDFSFYDTSTFGIDTRIDSSRTLRATVSVSGRVAPCAPASSAMGGPACN